MRIFAISDLHGDSSLCEQAAQHAAQESVDVVLIAGDISQLGREFVGVIEPFTRLNVPIMFVGGNHDDHERMAQLAEEYGAIHLDGYGIVIGDVGFIGTRGLNLGPSRQNASQITESLESAARYAHADSLVMMTHTHPSGTQMATLSRYVRPSGTIESLIRSLKPDLHICGHVHEGAGLVEQMDDTNIVNVARTSTIIDL